MCWLIGLAATSSGTFIALKLVFLFFFLPRWVNIKYVIDTNHHILSITKNQRIKNRLELEKEVVENPSLFEREESFK